MTKLCVLFLNDTHTLFHVTIQNYATVHDLKEAIKTNKCCTGKHYNAADLLLYKLNESLPIAPTSDLARSIANKGDIERFAVLLEEPTHRLLGGVFPGEVDDMRLHLLVKLPLEEDDEPPAKRARLESLHPSALNDEEYSFYRQALVDIAGVPEGKGDEYYERIVVGIREVRAWLLGRFPHVLSSQIDTILNYFSPTMDRGDTLSGGQFLAALRLVRYAGQGQEEGIDRALVFVQPHSTPAERQSRHETSQPLAGLSRLRSPISDQKGPEAEAVLDCPPRGIGAWLMEIHRKIWNQKDQQQNLFRTVRLEFSDYERLERRLAGLRSGRREAADSADILRVKLAFLQSISSVTPDPRSEEKVGDSCDLHDELRAFFPFTLEYLDTSSLELRVSSPRIPVPLLIRQEYHALSGLLGELPVECAGSAIITGQPGTGKTAYLYLKMIEFMIAGIPFLFQTMEGIVYLVQESIAVVNSWLGGHIVAFCDADGLSSRPSQFILESHDIQIIAMCPPEGASQKWMEEMGGMSHVMKYVTTLWSPQELFSVGCDSSTGLRITLISS